MLDNTYTYDYGGTLVTLTRIDQSNYQSRYAGTFDNGNGKREIDMTVKHTLPAKPGAGESHLVRIDHKEFDTSGVYQRTQTAWLVMKTFDGVQNSTGLGLTTDGMLGIFTSALRAKVIGRES